MSPKSLLMLLSLFLLGLTASAQYTEKINTNRPGTSQGAFSVGNNVLQIEGGFGFGKQKHKLRKTKTNTFNFDYAIRYGLLIEQLEINIDGSFRSEGIRVTVGGGEEKIRKTDFEYNTLGVKYLIYDPYKKPKDQDSINYDELKSWKERYRFKWKNLIPAVSAYVGMNYVNTENAFTFTNDPVISPKFVVMTQNNWWTSKAGSWVLVTNLIVDKITTENPAYGWIITSTHTLNDKWAVFGEYQGQKSDFYSDNIIRFGGAYLFNNDLQVDANIATNFKDTPSIFRVSVGASYRFDWHYKDEIIEKPGFESGIQKGEEEEKEGEEDGDERNKDGFDIDEEMEGVENDSLKQEKTPFINEFEDGSHRDAMEQDLDKRRTEQRLERERLEKEKQDKKDDKKSRKEERRRLKREAKEAKQAEKARIKAEKEKQKMIEDIDAELDKMEQDDGVDDELKQIDDELKKLEEMEKDLDPESTTDKKETESEKKEEPEDEEDVDAAYDKLQKEQAKAKKEEEKRRKKEEKRRLKEEKKRKKEEEKRKKAEEKKKKEEEDQKDDDNKED